MIFFVGFLAGWLLKPRARRFKHGTVRLDELSPKLHYDVPIDTVEWRLADGRTIPINRNSSIVCN